MTDRVHIEDTGTDGTWFSWYCPGCEDTHSVPIEPPPAPRQRPHWDLSGPTDLPTLRPSVLVHSHKAFGPDDKTVIDTPQCHCFINSGTIQFLGDCTHRLAGQTVPIPLWPPRPDAPTE